MAPPRRLRLSWVEDIPRRVALESSARLAYPEMTFSRRQRHKRDAVYTYELSVEVPGYEPRCVRIEFPASNPLAPRVFTDGPTDSPHRYGGRRLCIWYPTDGDDQRWIPEDGLLALIGMTTTHLFKEAYWRETGEWLGEEAPHGILPGEADAEPSDRMEQDLEVLASQGKDRGDLERQRRRRGR